MKASTLGTFEERFAWMRNAFKCDKSEGHVFHWSRQARTCFFLQANCSKCTVSQCYGISKDAADDELQCKMPYFVAFMLKETGRPPYRFILPKKTCEPSKHHSFSVGVQQEAWEAYRAFERWRLYQDDPLCTPTYFALSYD